MQASCHAYDIPFSCQTRNWERDFRVVESASLVCNGLECRESVELFYKPESQRCELKGT